MDVNTKLARTFAALGDPTRLRILAKLAKGPSTCKDLEAPFEISQQAVSKHIRVLHDAGLVSQQKAGRMRICEIVPDAYEDAIEWIEFHRNLWASRFDKLDDFLKAKTARKAGDG